MGHRLVHAALLALVVLVLGGPAGAQSGPAASARATGVSVVVPGGKGGSAATVEAPPRAVASIGSWSYGDGAVGVGSTSTAAGAGAGTGGSASSSATVRSVSLFGGEIRVDAVVAKASARASGSGAAGSLAESSLSGLVVLGEPVEPAANARLSLSDWGYVIVLEQAVVRRDDEQRGFRGFVTGLHVVLTKEHGGLPAGTEVRVGYAEAAASAPRPKPAQEPEPPTSGG
ncbi:MAG TPA: choice-of-anchor P family protein, partial [Gaiellaceae bacterium]|nr:choice-of-anchor P family protein [Gaiellaceae bacterium]